MNYKYDFKDVVIIAVVAIIVFYLIIKFCSRRNESFGQSDMTKNECQLQVDYLKTSYDRGYISLDAAIKTWNERYSDLCKAYGIANPFQSPGRRPGRPGRPNRPPRGRSIYESSDGNTPCACRGVKENLKCMVDKKDITLDQANNEFSRQYDTVC